MSTLHRVYFLFLTLFLSLSSLAQTAQPKADLPEDLSKILEPVDRPNPKSTSEKNPEVSKDKSQPASNNSTSSTQPAAKDTASNNQEAPATSPTLEPVTEANPQFKNWGVTGNFSLFEMWVLTKYGITGYYTNDPKRDWELEYMRGSLGFGYFGINIGSIQEQRISLLTRSFGKRNSLNFLYGVFYNEMNIGLSQKFLSTVNAGMQTNVNNIELATAGLTWGFGNRWQTREGYIFGVDWLVINIPFSTLQQRIPFLKQSNDQDSRDSVKDALKWFKKIPSAGILKFQIGLTF